MSLRQRQNPAARPGRHSVEFRCGGGGPHGGAARTAGSRAAIMAEVLQCHVFARPDFANGRTAWRRASRPDGGRPARRRSTAFREGGPHGGGGPHGTPLRLGTPSRHGRRAPRGAPLHGGRQQQIRGSVPSHGARVPEVRIHLPPAKSPLRTCFARLGAKPRCSRTGGSNPSPSSEESNANLMPTTSSQPPVRHDIRGPRILAA